MKLKVFFDTNVILDVLLGDRPNSSASNILFEVVKEGLMEGVVTTQSLLDAAYIVGKMRAESRGAIRQQILNLMKFRAYHSGDTRIRFITPSELVSLMRED